MSEILKKHKPLSRKEIEKRLKEREAIKAKLTTDAAELERNLMEFNKRLDPLIDPITKKVLCWIRHPTQKEWDEMFPEELVKYGDNVPVDVLEKYRDLEFELMAKIIEKPKHDAQWWKEHANLVFRRLFQSYLTELYEVLGIKAENF